MTVVVVRFMGRTSDREKLRSLEEQSVDGELRTDKRGQTGKIVNPYGSEWRDGRGLYTAQRAIPCEGERMGDVGYQGGNKGVCERIVIREPFGRLSLD